MLLQNRYKAYQAVSEDPMRRKAFQKRRFFTATEVADALGISKQTLLRYEARGVFPKAARNRLNHWREYTDDEIQRLRSIMGR